MKAFRAPHAFILGCERSGSTWLSNVLDAHPGIEFFMEPFADYTGLFPGFPSRNLYAEHHSDAMANAVSTGYDNLAGIKYPLFYSRKRSLRWKKVDKFIIDLYTLIGKCQHFSAPDRVKQFELLNLNSVNTPIKWQVEKNEVPALVVTKELRLNFKVGLLHRVFPQAKYIIVVRHPGAQVASIMKLFERGNLGEFRRSLLSLYAHLLAYSRFDKYSNYYKCLDGENATHEMLLLWWLINYETIIEDCKRYKVDYRIVYNEDLSEHPEEEYRQIFSFLELDYTQDVQAYISHSTTGPTGKSSAAVFSPVNTVRDSSKHSKECISNIDDGLKRGISSLYEHFDVIDELSRYRER